MKKPSPKVRVKPGGLDDRISILDLEASINATPEIAKAAAQREAVLEAGGAVEFWMNNARRMDGGTGLKQSELAQIMGVSQARISQLVNAERGQGPSYALLRRICLACGFSWPHGLVEALQGEAQLKEPQKQATTKFRSERKSATKRHASHKRRVYAFKNVNEEINRKIAVIRIIDEKIGDMERNKLVSMALTDYIHSRRINIKSEDYAITTIDEEGNLDLDQMTIIETRRTTP